MRLKSSFPVQVSVNLGDPSLIHVRCTHNSPGKEQSELEQHSWGQLRSCGGCVGGGLSGIGAGGVGKRIGAEVGGGVGDGVGIGVTGLFVGAGGAGKRIGAEVGDGNEFGGGVGMGVTGLFVRAYEKEVKLPVPDLDETTTPFSKTRTVHSSESPL